jgi:hypothetical protein
MWRNEYHTPPMFRAPHLELARMKYVSKLLYLTTRNFVVYVGNFTPSESVKFKRLRWGRERSFLESVHLDDQKRDGKIARKGDGLRV